MFVYRIEKKKYKDSLTGIGGTIVAGRWNFARYPIIYTSEHPATARLETLLNWSLPTVPKNRLRLTIYIPDDTSFTKLQIEDLPAGWDSNPHIHWTREFGNKWLETCESLILYVPCSEEPEEWNVLINPRHPEFLKVQISEVRDITFNPRLRPEKN